MAMRGLTRRLVKALTKAVVIVMPAEGPSFGIAPSGTWICTAVFSNTSGLMPSSLAWALT